MGRLLVIIKPARPGRGREIIAGRIILGRIQERRAARCAGGAASPMSRRIIPRRFIAPFAAKITCHDAWKW